jgi:flagellar basal-body rod protein FlgF
MIKGIQTTGSAMKPMMTRMEVIGNNLANINTVGFKKDNVFIHVLKTTGLEQAKGAGEIAGYDSRKYTDFSEGSLQQTGNPLDVALQGRGFFVVDTPGGVQLTRNGNFTLSLDGTLVTSQGRPVMGTEGYIHFSDIQTLPAGKIAITEGGEITVDKKIIGKLRIAEVADATALKKNGDSFLVAETSAPIVIANPDSVIVRQGYLEESNVEGLEELITMVELARNFESGQKAIQYQDGTLERLNEVGRF